MLHYIYIRVSDLERSGSFYDTLLSPLGWRRHVDGAGTIGWGIVRPVFFVVEDPSTHPGFGQVSFPANSIPAVKASFESGTRVGGEPVGEPGSKPTMGAGNYCCRLRDPDGYLVEIAVAH